MKFRYILAIALMLAVLTLGAVSASENLTADNQANDYNIGENTDSIETQDSEVLGTSQCDDSIETQDSEVLEASQCDDLIEADGEKDIQTASGNEPQHIYIYDRIEETDDKLVLFDDDVRGSAQIFINDKLYYNTTLIDGHDPILWGDLRNYKELGYAYYNVKVVWKQNETSQPVTFEKVVQYNLPLSLSDIVVQKPQIYPSVKFRNEITFSIYGPKDAKNKFVLQFNGKTYKLTPYKGSATLKITVDDLALGLHNYSVSLEYKDYPKNIKKAVLHIDPVIIYQKSMSVGEDEYVHVIAPKNTNGDIKLYDGHFASADYGATQYVIDKMLQNVKLTNGYAKVPLKKLSKGDKLLSLEYTIGNYKGERNCSQGEGLYIKVFDNSKGFKAKVKPLSIKKGQKVTVKLTGPKINKKAKIYVDNKLYKSVSLKKGIIKQDIKKLSAGTHKVKVVFNKAGKSFSKTFYIKVKKIPKVYLKLNEVKVKKSSKKLTLKATLKIKGKAKKGLKVKFKFDKNSFKVKTNKKGVAKVAISPKIIKKLKVGQKVKYSVRYGKTIKKLTAVVAK